jgi:ABC-2 type transport system ATP-binding protein
MTYDPPPAVRLRGVTKSFGAKRALDGFDLTVAPGQIVGFLGPNGAGKTTAMRTIMGLAAPDAGEVDVFGHAPGTPAALARTGALIETPALYPAQTARGHLATVARWAGVPAARVGAVLELVGLTGTAGQKTAAFSLGMKQRLGVATALLKDPPLLVLDEPSNGLDPEGMRDMRATLANLRDSGHTVLLSSHLLGEVEQVADRVAIVQAGRVVREGALGELLAGETTAVALEIDPVDVACQALLDAGVVAADGVAASGGCLHVTLAAGASLHPVLATLIAAGVVIRAVETQRANLLDTFFATTAQG